MQVSSARGSVPDADSSFMCVCCVHFSFVHTLGKTVTDAVRERERELYFSVIFLFCFALIEIKTHPF